LEGILYIPGGSGPFSAVVVCHPHPQYGGSMDNNVVNSICESLVSKSIVSFKFNFRGVNGSQGFFGNGIGEIDDVQAAISFVSGLGKVKHTNIGLVGYSAGAAWGLSAGCQDRRIKAVAAISPPINMFDFSFLQNCTLPRLMISGSEDDFVPIEDFNKFNNTLIEPKECLTIPGIDHFWWGYESYISEKVTNFFVRILTNN
jgi:uncharacterized protein